MRSSQLTIAAVSLVLAGLVTRNAVVETFRDERPDVALTVAPNDPGALIAKSRYTETAPNAPTSGQMALLERAARGDPLYPDPFLAKAALDQAGGAVGPARQLAEAARARDPRWLATHAFLLTNLARTRDLPAAVATINTLADLSSTSASVLGKTLATAATDPQAARLLATALAANPRWREAFIGEAAGPAQSLAFATLVAPPRTVAEVDKAKERSVFIERLMQAGDYQRAYLAWVNFLPTREAGAVQAIYDGDFRGGAGVEPFSWTLVNNEAASAERRTDSALPGGTALDVNFFGHNAGVIATEALFVGPGSYWFDLAAAADGGGQSPGALRWSLLCLPARTSIPLAAITRFDGRSLHVHQAVTIPERGCSAQQLSLDGDPGEIATPIHAQFTGLRITPR